MTCRPQLIELLLAISLCLLVIDLPQVKAKYVTKLKRKKGWEGGNDDLCLL